MESTRCFIRFVYEESDFLVFNGRGRRDDFGVDDRNFDAFLVFVVPALAVSIRISSDGRFLGLDGFDFCILDRGILFAPFNFEKE